MKKGIVLLFYFWISACYAATVPADVPQWLQQVAQEKHRAPEQLLALMQDKQSEFAALSPEAQAFWLNQQATMLSHLGRYQEQQQVAERGLALLDDKPSFLQAELKLELGFAREMQFALTDAMTLYQQGVEVATALGNEKLRIRGLVNIAAVDLLQSRDQQALQSLKEAYQRAEELQDKELLAEVNAQLGLMYSSLSFEEEAQGFLEQALALYEELGWHKNRISVLYNLARNYSYLENFELAMQSFDRMLQSALQEEDVLNLYYAYSGLAITSNEMSRPLLALNYMEKAEEYLPVIHSDYYLAGHYYEKALIYQNLQQSSLAMQQLLMAEQYLTNIEQADANNLQLAFRLLKAELQAEQGQFERAYLQMLEFMKGFQRFRDKENELALAKARMVFETERAQANQDLQQQQQQLQTLQAAEIKHNKVMRWMWFSLVVLAAMLTLTLALLLRGKKAAAAQPHRPAQQDKA